MSFQKIFHACANSIHIVREKIREFLEIIDKHDDESEPKSEAAKPPSTSTIMKMNNGRLQFFNLVKAMRDAQMEYFYTRSHEALQKAH